MSNPALTLCEFDDAALPTLESFSPFCVKVHRALKLANLPYARRAMRGGSAELRRLNRAGQVPVLLVGGEAVVDSTRILARLDAMTGGALVQSLDARDRAEAWLWEDYADTALSGFLVAARWADPRNWPLVRRAYFGKIPGVAGAFVRAVVAPRVRRKVLASLVARDVTRAGLDACWDRFVVALAQLEARAPAVGFWVGARPTVADLALFAQLHSLRTSLTRFQANQIALRPRLSAWLERVDAATRGEGVARDAPRPLKLAV